MPFRAAVSLAAAALLAAGLAGCGAPGSVKVDRADIASVNAVFVWPAGALGSTEETATIKSERVDALVAALKESRRVRSEGPDALLTTVFVDLKNGDDIELQAGDGPAVRVTRGTKSIVVTGEKLTEWMEAVRLD